MKKIFMLTVCIGFVLVYANDADILPRPMPFSVCPIQIVPKAVDDAMQSEAPVLGSRAEDSLYFGDQVYVNALGLTSGGKFEWGIRITPVEFAPFLYWNIVAIKFYKYSGVLNDSAKVYDEGTPTQPGALLVSVPYSSPNPQEWVRVDLPSPIQLTLQEFWCTVTGTHNAGDYPAGMCGGPAVAGKGDWLYYSGAWQEIKDLGFDNNWMLKVIVDETGTPFHDVGCIAVTSPPAGFVTPGNYDVIGRIVNYGTYTETFNTTANVYDTTGGGWSLIFTQTVNMTSFPSGGDSLVNFGQVSLSVDRYFYTEIFTSLGSDENPFDDLSVQYTDTWTQLAMGDVIYELDVQTPTGDNQLLGVEFDGTRFYTTGGAAGTDPNHVYVFDTSGALLWTCNQPGHATGWGWRDLAWDYVNGGPASVDTLYTSVNTNVDKFSINLSTGALTYHGPFAGPANPNRALAYDGDDGWFFTATFTSNCYKFSKTNPNIQQVANTYSMYGSAYDGEANWVWWHSQDDPGTGYRCQIEQMDPQTMAFTGLTFGYTPTIVNPSANSVAGGLCYWGDFRGWDVLFALVQGDPVDAIIGIYLRNTIVGVEEQTPPYESGAFGFARNIPNPAKGVTPIIYATKKRGMVSLKVFDLSGRHVETLVNGIESSGLKTVHWDTHGMANGVYFLKLTTEEETTTHKLILVQ